MPKKGKVYILLREESEEVHKFILKQLRKEYIRLSKVTLNGTSVFCREKGWKEIYNTEL